MLGRQTCLVDRILDRVGIGFAHEVRHLPAEAWALLQQLS